MLGKNYKVSKLDFKATLKEIYGFIRTVIQQAGASGVVVGLSGGVDSSLTVALCVGALGREKVLGLFMPAAFTPQQDTVDAQELANRLGIRTVQVSIDEIGEVFIEKIKIDRQDTRKRKAIANIRARIRMVILYYYSNIKNYLVAGTSDRSEILIGFFTKHGDGGADFLPISHLYKTQVRELARHMGISKKIANKPSSPQLYHGHKLSDELPLSYNDLDPILVGLFDNQLSSKEVSRMRNIPLKIVEDIRRRFEASRHKRSLPPRIIKQSEVSSTID
jgi:NAD+ synthase